MLVASNNEVISFEQLSVKIAKEGIVISEERTKKIIEELRSIYLIYSNEEISRIVSIIDTSK